jgi:hypothetical protein
MGFFLIFYFIPFGPNFFIIKKEKKIVNPLATCIGFFHKTSLLVIEGGRDRG